MGKYAENYENIFGDDATRKKRLADSASLAMRNKSKRDNSVRSAGLQIIKPIEPFVSGIDGKIISDRSHLRAHNKKHGVTDIRDYSSETRQRLDKERCDRMTGNTRNAKEHRIESIKHAFERNS